MANPAAQIRKWPEFAPARGHQVLQGRNLRNLLRNKFRNHILASETEPGGRYWSRISSGGALLIAFQFSTDKMARNGPAAPARSESAGFYLGTSFRNRDLVPEMDPGGQHWPRVNFRRASLISFSSNTTAVHMPLAKLCIFPTLAYDSCDNSGAQRARF